jgi:hypothetical protein
MQANADCKSAAQSSRIANPEEQVPGSGHLRFTCISAVVGVFTNN